MAVSGCPRNCAEATCKDVGVICVESGYEIHFAGAAGLDIKGTEVLGLVKTEDEALEMIVALVQMYREQGRYLERIYKWAKRVGVDEIKPPGHRRSASKRKAYYDRFVFSQQFAQVDPWAERVAGKDKHEFTPMADGRLRAGGGVRPMTAGSPSARSPTFRAAARAASPRRTAGSPCSAPPTTRSSPSRTAARTKAAR